MRTISKNLTIQYHNVIYPIRTRRPPAALRHAKVTVCENTEGQVTILYRNQPLAYSIFQKPIRQAQVVTGKTLDFELRQPYVPPPNHPWRQYDPPPNGKPIQEAVHHGTG
jgi:hypothetical protein